MTEKIITPAVVAPEDYEDIKALKSKHLPAVLFLSFSLILTQSLFSSLTSGKQVKNGSFVWKTLLLLEQLIVGTSWHNSTFETQIRNISFHKQ